MININDFDSSNLSSWIGTVASIINIIVAVCIYRKWKVQKRLEVIANDANTLLNEVTELRKEILNSRTHHSNDEIFICYIGDKRDSIENILKNIVLKNKDLDYKEYISSITELIRKWQSDKHSDDSQLLFNFGKETNKLIEKLTKLKLYYFDK